MNIQEWAEGLLDDQRPLEVLYKRYQDQDVIIIKIGTRLAIVKDIESVTEQNLVYMVFMMADQQLGYYASMVDVADKIISERL